MVLSIPPPERSTSWIRTSYAQAVKMANNCSASTAVQWWTIEIIQKQSLKKTSLT